MNNDLHRTADWQRLKQAGFLTIHDQPGRIGISRTSPMEKNLNWVLLLGICFPVGMILLGQWMGGSLGAYISGTIGVFVGGIIIFGSFIPGKVHIAKYADSVVFTPQGVTFFQAGRNMGSLRREAMQQIVADCGQNNIRFHRFIADNGYMSAFPMSDQTEHLLINNILMAAFAQPIYLDFTIHEIQIKAEILPPKVDGLLSMPKDKWRQDSRTARREQV